MHLLIRDPVTLFGRLWKFSSQRNTSYLAFSLYLVVGLIFCSANRCILGFSRKYIINVIYLNKSSFYFTRRTLRNEHIQQISLQTYKTSHFPFDFIMCAKWSFDQKFGKHCDDRLQQKKIVGEIINVKECWFRFGGW